MCTEIYFGNTGVRRRLTTRTSRISDVLLDLLRALADVFLHDIFSYQ